MHTDKIMECFVIYILPDWWQSRLNEYETMLSNSPKDPTALEVSQECSLCSALFCISENIWKNIQGAAVTLAELGEYARAASLLEDLTKVYYCFDLWYLMNFLYMC